MVAGDLSAGRILRLLARFGWLLEEGAIVGMRALAVTGALSLLPTRRAAALLTDLAARLRRRALRAVGFAFRVGAECRRHANE
jgi:hypothetical protein